MNLHAVMWWGVGRTLLAGLTRATTSIKVYGAERIPREGGAVLAVNHIHWVDIPVIGATCPRRISYLAKAEVDAVPLAGAFIRSFGTLFVRRGQSDRDAVRLAREAVRDNLLLGMFVEGTRQRDGRPGEAKPGAAMVAIQEGVPVVPAAIYGTQRWRVGVPRPKVGLAWGEPMRFSEYPRNSKGYRKATEEIETEIRRLWEFLKRMEQAGWPDGVPPRRAAVPSKSG